MPDLSEVFSRGVYDPNALSIATALSAVSVLFLGLAVLSRARVAPPARYFFVVSLTTTGWLICFAPMLAATDPDVALVWGRVGHLFAALIPASVFQFAAEASGIRKKLRPLTTLFWTVAAAVAAISLVTDAVMPSVRRYSWGYYPHGPVFRGAIMIPSAIILFASIYVFWRAYRDSEGRAKERSAALLLAFVLGTFSMFDYLPAAGVDMQPIGFFAAFVFAVVSATAVWRFDLVDLTPEYAAAQILETMKSAVVVVDMQGQIRVVNRAACSMLGYQPAQLLGNHIRVILEPTSNLTTGQLLNSMGVLEHMMVWRHAEGTRIDVLAASSFVRNADGTPVGVVYVASDFTERKRAEEELRQSEERYRELFQNAQANEARYRLLFERNLAGVYRTAVSGRVLDCNEACARIFGFETREELLAETAPSLYFDAADRELLVRTLREQKTLTNQELRMRRRDGSVVWVLENVSLLEGRTPAEDVLEGTIIDITDRRHAQEQIEHQAFHDSLTGLPNRRLFRDRIGVALAHARRSGRSVAVMFLDLDQFKLVNDTLGHTAGDRLLQAIGSRLVNCVRGDDTVARMGGDEFTILLADLPDRRGAATVAQKVLDSMRHPVVIDEHELFLTTSIGIAIFPEDGDDAEALLRNADRAMYRAKELGRDNFQYAANAAAADGRLLLERNLHRALERDEFVVHYQPMVEIATGRVVGAEALVRWNHPEDGLVPPDAFIPTAEESQLIIPLGEWVLRTACRQMKAWHDAGHDWLRVAVNLSARQFQQRDLPATVERILAETGFPAHYLDLEITESTAMQNADMSLAILNRLKAMGIRISIDDFGTGYSSLSYLKRFPIDTVKIDQDFVRDLSADANDSAIISAVISMARALNLRVIAEGVETEEQLAFLRREQCAEMQGFLYSRPLPAEEFARALETAGVRITPTRLRPFI